MRSEQLEVGSLGTIGKFFEVALTEKEIDDVTKNKPYRRINDGVAAWRNGRRPDNPFSTSPEQTRRLLPVDSCSHVINPHPRNPQI